ncbi:MAG: hypothetical protein NVSMB52_21290 [Chloroflexota bacterium]
MVKLEFDATVQPTPRGGGGAYVPLPSDAAELFGTRARFAVRVRFNGVPYAGSTMPKGDGTFCVGITQAIRAEAKADIGEMVHVVLERDEGERIVEVPDDLWSALDAVGLTAKFGAMAYTHRKEYARWVTEAKRADTRTTRIVKAVEMIRDGSRLS